MNGFFYVPATNKVVILYLVEVKAFGLNIIMGIQELWNNPLRTFLSILGVSIGVFCIVSVSTVFGSMETNIQNNMASLGNDVLYVGKFAWIPKEGEEYAWWRYKARPVMSKGELNAIQEGTTFTSYSALSYGTSEPFQFMDNKVSGAQVYAVTNDFNKLQPIDLAMGRYFSLSEMKGGISNGVIIGKDLAEELFGSINPIDKEIKISGRLFHILGVIKKTGQMTTGFDFDGGAIISYNYFSTYNKVKDNTNNGFADPMLMIKAKDAETFDEMKFEVEGVLRRLRGLKAIEKNNFAFNQLDGIQEKIAEVFLMIKYAGWIIGAFSLIVGIFSVANIMFVSVKERTNIIGIKKAIGAQKSAILIEFLIEAVLLCLFGGAFGMLLTYILTLILSSSFEFPVFINLQNVIYGILLSVAVGLLAGFIPAYRAAKLDPVEAIRS